MRIAQLATNVEKVPPDGYGGTELIVSLLTEQLVNRGHEVTLFATGNSQTKARLVPTTEEPLRTDPKRKVTQWPAFDIRTCLKVREMREQFDVIHNHMGYPALPYLESMGCAVLTTNHNQVKTYCREIFFAYGHLPYVAISNSYIQLNYPDKLNYVATIYNGIDVEAFTFNPSPKRDYLLFVGRLGHDKGTAEAIDIAAKLGLPLILAGKIDKNDQPYVDSEVKPRLEAYPQAKYIGEVNHKQKTELYANAIAVVYPINFNEPFGLVMVESLASGTPVLAFDRGSVREVLTDPETAIIGQSVDELVRRFPEVKQIKAAACRERASRYFGLAKMVESYERLYIKLIEERQSGTFSG